MEELAKPAGPTKEVVAAQCAEFMQALRVSLMNSSIIIFFIKH
jgi:hypothetical protein